jgi:hypothetical protein
LVNAKFEPVSQVMEHLARPVVRLAAKSTTGYFGWDATVWLNSCCLVSYSALNLREETIGMLLLIILLILLFGGGGGYYGYRGGYYGGGGLGIVGLIVIILVVFLLLGGGFGHGVYYR